MIDRIRIMLGLQAKAVTPLIHVAGLAGEASVEKIPRVKLHARFDNPWTAAWLASAEAALADHPPGSAGASAVGLA